MMTISIGWAALVAVINPFAEVILNDDGIYASSVKSILETGVFKLSAWVAPNLFSQVYWGALFCLPFGFSYTALRFSTLTLALGALLALYGLLREIGMASTWALFGVLILALNPLFVVLSFTFMTDVPFLGFTLIAMYLLVRGIKRKSKTELALGLFVATVALLTRQLGLALFLALSLSQIVRSGLTKRNVVIASFPTILGLSVQFLYQTWLNTTGRTPNKFGLQAARAMDVNEITHVASHIATGAFGLAYTGLFVLPLVLSVSYGRLREFWRKQRWIAIWTSAAWFTGAIVLIVQHHRMPFVGNVLYDIGLGPALIRDDLHALPTAGRFFWGVVTAISLVAAALFLQVLIAAVVLIIRTHGKHQDLLLMTLATGFIYIVPIALQRDPFDRYFLFLVPLAIIIVFVICGEGKVGLLPKTVGILCLSIYGMFAIAGTHDYLAWNRVRWQALRTLVEVRHIPPERIQGGNEFDVNYNSPERKWIDGDDFLVSFSPAQGYVESEQYTFRRWLPPGQGAIFVLHRSPNAPLYSWAPSPSLVRRLFCTELVKVGSMLGVNCRY